MNDTTGRAFGRQEMKNFVVLYSSCRYPLIHFLNGVHPEALKSKCRDRKHDRANSVDPGLFSPHFIVVVHADKLADPDMDDLEVCG